MASEAVVYRLELAGNLKTEATATAGAVAGLGAAAEVSRKKVEDHSKSAEAAKLGMDQLKRSVGESAAGLVQFGGAAGVAAAAIGLTVGAVVKLANASIEARDRLREMNVFLDTPSIDRYADATSNLATAFDELKVSVGEGLTGPMASVLDMAARAIVLFADLSTAMRESGQLFTWWTNPTAAGATIAGVLAGDPNAGILPTDTTGPTPWTPGRAARPTGGARRSVSDYVGDPNGYRMGPGMVVSEGYGPDYAGAMSQGLSAGLNNLGRAMIENTAATEANTSAAKDRAAGAVGAALSGGGLGTVVGTALGGPLGAILGPTIDNVLGGGLPDIISGLGEQVLSLLTSLPDMVGTILSDTVPALLASLPEMIAAAITLGPELVVAIVGSLDDIALGIIDAILGLPAAIADALNPFATGAPGINPSKLSRRQQQAMFYAQSQGAASLATWQTMNASQRSRGASGETFRRIRRDQGSYGLGYNTSALVP